MLFDIPMGSGGGSGILENSGSMRSGRLFAHQMSVLPIAARDCSSSRSWPTPVARDYKGSSPIGPRSRTSGTLDEAAEQKWTTPRAFMHKDSTHDRGRSNIGEVAAEGIGPLDPTETGVESPGGSSQQSMPLWTTPQAHDATGLGDPQRVRRYGTKHGAANLVDDAAAHQGKVKRRLNPNFVCWLMGFPPGWTLIETETTGCGVSETP